MFSTLALSWGQEKYDAEKIARWGVLDMIKDQGGKVVTLHLNTGASITGTLSSEKMSPSAKTIYLTKLSPKDFYGALVDIKSIIAIEFHNKSK